MVLHTLLEQGLSEADQGAGDIRFRLDVEAGRRLRLRLSHGAPQRPHPEHPDEGTGLRYVEARLEEAFPGRWRLDAAREGGSSWAVSITIDQPVPLRA
jgi:hypothetical protein